MAIKRNALGRGLDSLISMDDVQTGGSSAINEIAIAQILPNPDQPRNFFDENALENRGCSSCGKHNCNSFHCPNCGFANSPELDQEFEFITKLKEMSTFYFTT